MNREENYESPGGSDFVYILVMRKLDVFIMMISDNHQCF